MQKYLVIDKDGLVQSLAMWDGVSEWTLPEGVTIELLNEGEYYEFGKPRGYTPPRPEQPIPE
jgi:hypothetical protein